MNICVLGELYAFFIWPVNREFIKNIMTTAYFPVNEFEKPV